MTVATSGSGSNLRSSAFVFLFTGAFFTPLILGGGTGSGSSSPTSLNSFHIRHASGVNTLTCNGHLLNGGFVNIVLATAILVSILFRMVFRGKIGLSAISVGSVVVDTDTGLGTVCFRCRERSGFCHAHSNCYVSREISQQGGRSDTLVLSTHLQSSQLARESVNSRSSDLARREASRQPTCHSPINDHLHLPRPTPRRRHRSLSDLSIMLPQPPRGIG